MEVINTLLTIVGAFSLGYGTYLGVKYLLKKIKWENPLKRMVNNMVLEYLEHLRKTEE